MTRAHEATWADIRFETDPSCAPGVAILDRATVRVALWPTETLDNFAAPLVAKKAKRLLIEERRLAERQAHLIRQLYAEIPSVESRQGRAYLLDVKRALTRDVGAPLPAPPLGVREELAARPAIEASIKSAKSHHARIKELRTRFDCVYESELCAQRGRLVVIGSTENFLKALALANPNTRPHMVKVDRERATGTRAKSS